MKTFVQIDTAMPFLGKEIFPQKYSRSVFEYY